MALLEESIGWNTMTDVILITKGNFPTIFKAFELVSHDCGRQAGHINYAVPMGWENSLHTIENRLKHLLETADSDFETLCIGEQSEAKDIVSQYKLELADGLLQRFFEEFQ